MRSYSRLVLVALLLVMSGCASTRPSGPTARSTRTDVAAGVSASAASETMVLVPNLLGVPESEAGANASAASEIDQARYVIGSEDVLHISVWREDGLTRQVRVRPDGRISFPLVGDVQAAGLTAPQLRAELTRLLQSYVTAPAVSVIVDEVNSYKIYVVGEVERPGALALKTPVTVLQALALAGGLKPFAHGNRMVLVRERDGKTERVRLNYRDLVLGRNGAVNLTLESGDTLVVP